MLAGCVMRCVGPHRAPLSLSAKALAHVAVRSCHKYFITCVARSCFAVLHSSKHGLDGNRRQAVLKDTSNVYLGPPLPRGVPGRIRTVISQGDRWFGADSGPDPGGNLFLIFILALSAARIDPVRMPLVGVGRASSHARKASTSSGSLGGCRTPDPPGPARHFDGGTGANQDLKTGA